MRLCDPSWKPPEAITPVTANSHEDALGCPRQTHEVQQVLDRLSVIKRFSRDDAKPLSGQRLRAPVIVVPVSADRDALGGIVLRVAGIPAPITRRLTPVHALGGGPVITATGLAEVALYRLCAIPLKADDAERRQTRSERWEIGQEVEADIHDPRGVTGPQVGDIGLKMTMGVRPREQKRLMRCTGLQLPLKQMGERQGAAAPGAAA